jgi:alkylation response protein AidB-like acyl-CoA dehydrogenase
MTDVQSASERENVPIAKLSEWLDSNYDVEASLEEWWDRSYRAGLTFPQWPAVAGGQNASSTDSAAIAAELAEREVPPAPSGNGTFIGAPVFIEFGSEEQKQEFLPALTRGGEAWCQLFSEPGAGSDLAGLQTRAVADGEEWIVNGQKVWCTQGDVAERGLLIARTNPEVPKHKGLSFFLIDMDQPGIEVRPIRQLDGGASFSEVFFTDARIPAGRLLGGEGNGWGVATRALAFERSNISKRQRRGAPVLRPGSKGGDLKRIISEINANAASVSVDRHAYALPGRQLIELARRQQLNADPIWRQKLVEYFFQTEVRRYTELRYRGGLPDTFDSAAIGPLSKLALSQIARSGRSLIFELSGSKGLVEDHDPLFSTARETALASFAAHFGGGTDQIQRNVIAERGLGLPREPAVDRDLPFSQIRAASESTFKPGSQR